MLSKNKQYSLHNYLLIALFTALLSVSSLFAQGDIPTDDASINNGKVLFENNCKSCHAVHEKVVGPALKGILERQKLPWLINWIHNPQKVISSGDPYATKLFAEYKTAGVMSGFPSFKDDEIKSILAYIKKEGDTLPDSVVKGPENPNPPTGGGVDAGFINIVLSGFIAVMILIVITLAIVISVLKKYLAQNEELLTESEKYLTTQKFDFNAIFRSTGFRFTLIFLLIGTIGKTSVDYLTSIGMQQGYAPKQPIPFSHKLHAGKYKIDCNYCHTGVRISKSANIPSANICMNCHSQIKTESPKLEKLRKSWATGKPIEWVRVHNLPDLAYFNHSQHVNVAGLECQQCHGPIEKMEVVQQYSPLTMGWCINCHRETVVKAEGNAYYDKLLQAHNKSSKEPLHVKDIGGLECSKCHY